MKWIKIIYQFFADRLRNQLNKAQYVLFVASLVGFVSGLTAVLLKMLVHYLQRWIERIPAGPAYLIFPAIGLVITVFIINKFFGGALERGIAMVLKSIARKSSFIPFSHTYSHVVTSTITVGVGGSVGLESPIVATGSAIGSNLARINNLNYRERSLLIACGAAAGIAGVFNAPIAGIIFAIEVLLLETVVSYFIPLIISAVIGTLCSKIILQEEALFNFVLTQKFNYSNVPFYILLGILSGFIALYYARIFKTTEKQIHNWKINPYQKALLGGLLLMIICFLFPPLFGEGYYSVKFVANGDITSITDNSYFFSHWQDSWGLLVFAISIVLLKPLAAAITIGSGGNGGNFAPSLFSGAYLGFSFSRLINSSTWVNIPEGNFSLVGMAGVLSGVMYCPLTAIFLIAEITNGYELFIPLMIVSSLSYFIVKHYEPYSMETKQLALTGQMFTHKKEENILNSISLKDMLQEGYDSISINNTVEELVQLIEKSTNNVFAVHDHEGYFAGIIELHDVKRFILRAQDLSAMSIQQIMKQPGDVIYISDGMIAVMNKFDKTNSWYLPVLDDKSRFIGFISKSRLFNKYREELSAESDLYDESDR